MNSGVLIYLFPEDSEFTALRGYWRKTTDLPTDTFFVSAFDEPGYYIFESEHSIELKGVDSLLHKKAASEFHAIERDNYLKTLREFMSHFADTNTEKAVFSRIQLSSISDEHDLLSLLRRLTDRYHDKALIYAVSSPEFGTWLGATPEIMLQGENGKYRTMSLAGTKKAAETPWTPKEIHEQALVTDFILNQLKSNSVGHTQSSGPETFFTGAVYHLKTMIHFSVEDTRLSKLLSDLNPTPAVCGLPRENALALIHQFEEHERSLYTGLIGFYGSKKTSIYVNLRCMQLLSDGRAAIYLGGGITPDSNPDAEWEETENKAKTLVGLGRR
jgi:isochorismate synthase